VRPLLQKPTKSNWLTAANLFSTIFYDPVLASRSTVGGCNEAISDNSQT
jgi:hypothetical protein